MMKKLFLLAVLFAVFAVTSCEDDLATITDAANDDSTTWNTCILELDGEIQHFDGKASRSSAWNDNDTIFIRFDNKGDYVRGYAYYNADISKWEVYYKGSLHDIENGYCNVFYFDGPSTINAELDRIGLNPYVAVYGDDFGRYSKSGNVVTVKANLAPLTGRIRFKGQPGYEIILMRSIASYSSFDVSNITFTTEHYFTKHIVGNDGYTPYIYGLFSSADRNLMIYNEEATFEKVCIESVLKKGFSGYMNIPTWDNCNGWTASKGLNYSKNDVRVSIPENESNISITLSGVTFKMIAVEGGTFTMGATPEQELDASDDEYPTHEVTLSDYFIGETEVTQELWEAITEYNPSHNFGTNRPVAYVDWNNCQVFVSKLSNLVGIKFVLPTEAQWEYAARGGSKSQKYRYSGSDYIGDVAWYSSNSNSNSHTVGTKEANELGIYDMTGNVCEWCSDWYGRYSSSSVTNPTGPATGTSRVFRGGSISLRNDGCRISNRGIGVPTENSRDLGLRLAAHF